LIADATSERAVHPVAALFPMMSDEELAELAEDIKERGQLQPIILGPDGEILDGRNRHEACRIAGIEPAFETYSGNDPDGYALTVNITRRHLATGARAVIAAQAARLNGMSTRMVGTDTNLYQSRVAEASLVLDFAPELVPQIVAGVTPLSVALPKARERKKATEQYNVKLKRLRDDAADLADLVAEGRLDLDEALAALEKREDEARQEAERKAREERAAADEAVRQEAEQAAAKQQKRRTATLLLCKLIPAVAEIDGEDLARRYDIDEEPADYHVTLDILAKAASVLDGIATVWQERELP